VISIGFLIDKKVGWILFSARLLKRGIQQSILCSFYFIWTLGNNTNHTLRSFR